MVKKLIVGVTTLALALVGVLVTVPSASAYTPANDTVRFNNPKGSNAKKYALIYELDKAINATPRNATITMAMYLFDRPTTTKALIRAYKRGVKVRLLIDDGAKNKEVRQLKKALGTNKARPSYVATCRRGCHSSVNISVMHAKLYLFSQSGSAKWVSIVSSGNPHYVNSYNSWNNSHTKTGDQKIYASLESYFLDMVKDKNNPRYYRTAASGDWKLFFYPRAPEPGVNHIVMLDVLNHVRCTGVAKGYGYNGRTRIRIGMWGWTAARNDIARRLWTLHNQGCKIDIIVNTGRMGSSPLKILLKHSRKYGQIKVYNAWRDRNLNNKGELYMHHKMVAINGNWFGNKGTKVVYTGSQNFTGPGTYANDDIILRVKKNSVYNAYSSNMSFIRDRYTKRLYSVPRVMNPAANVNGKDRVAAPAPGEQLNEFDDAAAAVDTDG